MNVNVEKLEKNMAKMTVTVPAEEFEKATVEAYNRQKNRISIPGFRKGHAPKAMIEKMYGAGIFYEEAVDIILDRTYPEACRESGLEIASAMGRLAADRLMIFMMEPDDMNIGFCV